jgi:hypothetical protein
MTLSFDNHTFGSHPLIWSCLVLISILDVMEFDGIEHDPVAFQNAEVYAGEYHSTAFVTIF